MPVSALDPCAVPLSPACAAGAVTGSVQTAASDYMLGGLGRAFLDAAEQVAQASYRSLDETTGIDLTAAWFRGNVAVIAAVALPVVVGLFVVQVLTSVLRREPGGLARAVVGVGKALVGSALALAVTQLALSAVDGICAFIAASADTTVSAAVSRFFDFVAMSTVLGPGLQLVVGFLLIVGLIALWGVMVFRKAALLLIAVFAPIAFAGSAWDQTRIWTRRWLEIVAALVFCKVAIVVVFVVGASAFAGVGPTTTGQTTAPAAGQGLSDVLVGLLLLSIAVLAPWLTWRFLHWSGMEAAAVMNSAVAASPVTTGARTAGRSGMHLAQQIGTSKLIGSIGSTKAARPPQLPVNGAAGGVRGGEPR
ncbi:hypothetical protein [Cellulomonas fimi]|uniref:TrbL/VirB6 plasmid conjugal transfer protein n=1 Tax=Cellulomonas fimi TaxID=1708 RepID=A0A7Y0QGT4_CELFI|nr:hypothetical protein [Cellulomonas fimi]NMR19199.1 hypothetical protein [Cellulomonas fimi]